MHRVDFAVPLSSCKLELISGRAHYERVLAAVREAKQSVWIATANLKELMVEDWRLRPGRRRAGRPEYRSVLEVFSELAERGVELRILHASLPSRAFREAFDQQQRLVRGGLELRMCPRVHMKTVIVDGRFLYLGSANWTGAGLGAKGEHRRNFELGMVTEDEAVLDEVQALYATIWSGAACKRCGRKDVCEAPLSL
jgi:phosphatidylserine/phosphatidylglycerophosphate/cardiolipin synthase-like enzyme